jgi:small subunit ribosomal protein S17
LETKRGNSRARTGVVTSNKMDKTVVVSVQRILQHPTYKKFIRTNTKVLAHDENNECQIGDAVSIMETRPLSRRKRWRVCEIIEKAM